ncbi:MAG TPA: FtsX-like permease family protein, partial [Acidimicrobiia bacterium]|nr:FtsX-like permease family protein [Acidimicrobiia bacterium]
ELRWITVIVGIMFGVVTGGLAALAPSSAVFHLSPAEAMRGEVPATRGRRSLIEVAIPPMRRLPVRWLMVFRGVGRNKLRSFSTMMGVVLALTLVLASWGMIDTVQVLLSRQFNEIDLSDATMLMNTSIGDDQVAAVAAVDGVAVAEPVITLPATAKFSGMSYGTQLQGYVQGTQVRGFLTDDGVLPNDGILAGVSLKDELGVDIGDTVTITFGTLETSITAVVQGWVNEPMGTVLYMDGATLVSSLAAANPSVAESTLQSPTVTSIAALFDDGVVRDDVISRIHTVNGVISVIDSRAIYDLVQQYMGLFYAFIGIMIVFGGAMAFALIFNTISVNVAERSTEYAMMRANGLSQARIAALITGENVLLVALGIIPGLIIGYLAAAWMMSTYSSDMIKFNLEMRPSTLILSAISMIIVALLSVIPGVRTVGRLNMVEVVRERAV